MKTTVKTSASLLRIVGAPVLPLLPLSGDVRVLIVGEAPGPRGADKSGVPFFGDAAGKHLYLALRQLGAVVLPNSVDEVKWDGALLRAVGYQPIANQVSLTNAFDRCPTDDGKKFRAPTRDELDGESNSNRLRREIDVLRARGLTGIVTLGKVAARTMQHVVSQFYDNKIPVHALPHPSAQGLLSMAPNRGRGARMADLQEGWMQQCMEAIRSAGFHVD
ncbi:MAG: uracil-DNA glycosylase family protein [Gemmatimonas sp.]